MAISATSGTTPARHPGRRWAAIALLLGSLLGPSIVLANVVIPATGVMELAAGTIDVACTDVIVAGTLNLDTGALVNVGNVVVQPGGVLNGDAGSITLIGTFTVLPGGQYNADESSVRYETTCGNIRRTAAAPVPTLNTEMIVTLSATLALLAMGFLGGLQRRHSTIKGVRK